VTPEAARQIVNAGARAPSGDNLQPWVVRWDGGALHISIDPLRDRSLYNFQYRASLIAVGAMIENMTIAARAAGLATTAAAVAPSGGSGLPSYVLTFTPGNLAPDPLHAAIERRCTNRRSYSAAPIAADVVQSIRESGAGIGDAELTMVDDRAAIKRIARAASLNDRFLFEVRQLHDQFFEAIRWSRAEAEASKDGLLIDTLELGPMRPGFRAMRSWGLVRMANLLGSSRLAPGHSYRTFLRSGAFGFLQMRSAGPQAYVDGGRALERIWLTATARGLAFQPMAGMLYLLWSMREAAGAPWVEDRRALLERAAAELGAELPLDAGQTTIMLFRIGVGPDPSATSLRRPL
jgi:hypothetical protein